MKKLVSLFCSVDNGTWEIIYTLGHSATCGFKGSECKQGNTFLPCNLDWSFHFGQYITESLESRFSLKKGKKERMKEKKILQLVEEIEVNDD